MSEVTCLFKGEFGDFVENCGQVYGLAFWSWMKVCSRNRQGLGYFHHLESVTILCACEERAPCENLGSKKAVS